MFHSAPHPDTLAEMDDVAPRADASYSYIITHFCWTDLPATVVLSSLLTIVVYISTLLLFVLRRTYALFA